MWKRAILIVVILLPLTCLGGVGWRIGKYLYWRQSAQNRVNAEIKRLQTAGEPLTAAELHAIHRVPAGTADLTDEWLAVLADLNAVRPDLKDPQLKELPLIGPRTLDELEPMSNNPCFSATQAFLARVEPQVQTLLELSARPGEVRFPVKFEDHVAANLDHVGHYRHAANVLELRARSCLIREEAEELDRTLSAIIALPHTLDESWTMIEQLFRCATIRRCCSSILEAANRGALTEEQLHKFATLIGEFEFKQAAWHTFVGERVMGWEAMDANASLIADDSGGLTALISSAGPVDRAFLLDRFARAVDASQHDYAAASREFERIDQDIRSIESLHPWERMHYFYSVMILLVPCGQYVAYHHQDAHCRMTQVALLAHLYRMHTGHWPSSVLELADMGDSPKRFADPFSSGNLRVREDGPHLMIYSVGADQFDDGGFEENERWKPDIVVTAKVPPMPANHE
jgi:hypothetical protein